MRGGPLILLLLRKGSYMRVGFIGLGTMGGSMALNARKGKHDLVVHDLREGVAAPHLEAGCRWADSPEAVARESEIVLTSLPGPREVEAVGEGLMKGLKAGTGGLHVSPNSPP